MKNSKLRRVLLLLACAVMLVSLSVGATLAYLTSTTKEVVNTFTVGKVAITLDEADVDENGDYVYSTDEDGEEYVARVTKNEYHLMPGQKYIKDPTIHIDGNSEEAYLRIVVTVTNSANTDAFFKKYAMTDVLDGIATTLSSWNVVSNTLDTETDTRTYVMDYKETIDGETDDIVLFSKIVIPGEVTNAELLLMEGTDLSIIAYAIQAEGFENAEEAWEAFDAQ